MKQFSRREFIKISSLGLGGVVASQPLFSWLNGAIQINSKELLSSSQIPTYCEVCFWK